jgi:transcriptional regulator with XRE-family HTH domain
MPPEKPKAFSVYLENKYLDWQKSGGGRRSLTDFAEYLGVDKGVLSNWMNAKRVPNGASIPLLVGKFGPTVYDTLGLIRPDPLVRLLTTIAGDLSEDGKQELIKASKRIQAKELKGKRGKLSTKPA